MIDDRLIKKLEKAIPKSQMRTLQDVSVYQDIDGVYYLFDTYSIEKINGAFLVSGNSMSQVLTFGLLKNAVAWCTFDKRNKISDANRILELDHKLSRIDSDINIRQQLASHAKSTDEKLMYVAKLGEDKVKRKLMIEQLDGYVRESRDWQNKRFETKHKH